MKPEDMARLERSIEWLERRARELGLDFFDMRYEICPAEVVYTVAGFGMPTRYSHWSFGKHYERHKLEFDLGLSRIYELVVNNDPCYAFLLENNSVLQNEMIVAHVLAHSDFFKNNARFRHTQRQMIDTMAATAERFRRYEERYGMERVEAVLDAALSIQEHIDPSWRARQHASDATRAPGSPLPKSGDLCEKDVLRFIVQHSLHLEDWERDIVATVREEMLYFWPQLETKIMNEGWATYWHTRLMREMDLSGDDAIEFAQLTASVTQPNRFALNPYNVGYAIWRDIERRHGTDKLFEVRECESDTGFLRNYLNQDIVDECQLYIYDRRGLEWVIVERDYRVIRDLLVQQRTNAGFPTLLVTDADWNRMGGLCLTHRFEGQELDVQSIERTLPRVYRLWGRPVVLRTVVAGREVEFVYDDGRVERRAM
jgi:stage V sporulation protein R